MTPSAPTASRTRAKLFQHVTPDPNARRSDALSWTHTDHPRFARAVAATRPAIPAPAISACRAAMKRLGPPSSPSVAPPYATRRKLEHLVGAIAEVHACAAPVPANGAFDGAML